MRGFLFVDRSRGAVALGWMVLVIGIGALAGCERKGPARAVGGGSGGGDERGEEAAVVEPDPLRKYSAAVVAESETDEPAAATDGAEGDGGGAEAGAGGAGADGVEDLRLEMDVINGERSKDSNSQHYVVTVRGRKVSYRGPYGRGERGRFRTKEVDFELTDEELEDVVRRVRRELLQSVEEKKDDKARAPSRYCRATATARLGAERGRIELRGLTMTRGSEPVLDNAKLCRALGSLGGALKRMAEKR